MFSPDFVYFISFLIFVFFAYRFGHKQMRRVLDDQIQGIAHTLDKANQEKEDAQIVLSSIKQELHDVELTFKKREQEIEERINALKIAHQKQLQEMLFDRERHHEALLNFEKQSIATLIKNELSKAVIDELSKKFMNDNALQESFQQRSLHLLENELVQK